MIRRTSKCNRIFSSKDLSLTKLSRRSDRFCSHNFTSRMWKNTWRLSCNVD